MGMLVEGVWHDVWYETKKHGGRFVRKDAAFRCTERLIAEPDRYHLYVSYACPWAHRTLLMRAFKGLESIVPASVVHWLMLEKGWTFSAKLPDHLFGSSCMHELYTRAKGDYTGRVTVPVLWDKKLGTIVCNESSEILRLFDGSFEPLGIEPARYYPEPLREAIDDVNERVYHHVNNGVYKAGFATTQAAYAEAVTALFDTLDWLEARLEGRTWLVGEQLTEADIRLWTTLLRFDPVYVGHFKCNLRRLCDYPRLHAYAKRFADLPGVRDTVHMDHIKQHYYASHTSINPHGVVPLGPVDGLI